MKLYLSGPMKGYPELNFPAFERARKLLRDAGYEVVCPAELGNHDGWEWEDYLRRDLKVLLDCNAIATLSGWDKSEGASLEVYVAQKLKMTVRSVENWLR